MCRGRRARSRARCRCGRWSRGSTPRRGRLIRPVPPCGRRFDRILGLKPEDSGRPTGCCAATRHGFRVGFLGFLFLHAVPERVLVLAWRLTSLGSVFFGRLGAFHGLADVVAPGPLLVLRAGRPSGTWSGRFRRDCRAGCCRADVAKPPADPGGGEAAGLAGPFPGAPEILGEGPGEAELGVGGDDQPGPQVGRVGIPDLRGGPAQGLFHQPEGVLQVEAAEEGLPPAVHVRRCGRGGRAPQPDCPPAARRSSTSRRPCS